MGRTDTAGGGQGTGPSKRQALRSGFEAQIAADLALLDDPTATCLALATRGAAGVISTVFHDGMAADLRMRVYEARKAVLAVERARRAQVIAFSEKPAAAASQLMGDSAVWSALTKECAPVPCALSDVTMLEWCQPTLLEHATVIASASRCNRTTAELHFALEADWDKKHVQISHASLPKLPKVAKRGSQCWLKGLCFCGVSGQERNALAQALCRLLRKLFSKGMELRPFADVGAVGLLVLSEAVEGRGLSCMCVRVQ